MNRSKRNRIISAFMLSSILITAFAGCADDARKTEGEPKETTATADNKSDSEYAGENAYESEDEIRDDLPELNYAGADVNMLSRDFERYKNELTVEEITGDVVNDAVYNRNLGVQNRLNVKIVNEKSEPENSHGPMNTMKNLITAGDDHYDLFIGSMFNSISESVNGWWKNLREVENLDLSKSYWSQYFIEKASVGDALYTITGDLAFSIIRLMSVTIYNQELAESYGITDLYDVVNEGKWTYDYEYNLVKDIYQDTNGDGKRGREDFYGLLTSDTYSVDSYTSAFDMNILGKDSDNYPSLTVNIEKTSSIVEKVNRLLWDTAGVYAHVFYGSDNEMDDIAQDFSEGKAVFMSTWLFSTETQYLREMQADYGILPYPKYNEEQSEYFSYSNDQFSVFVIPKTVSDDRTPMIGAFLEAMCSASKGTVVEAYLDTALKSKYSRDSDSAAMLDIIVSGFKLDPSWMYCTQLNNLPHNMLRNPVRSNSNDIASKYEKFERSYIKYLDKLNEKFKGLE